MSSPGPKVVCDEHIDTRATARGDDPSLLRRSGRNIRSTVTWRSTAADAKKRIGRERRLRRLLLIHYAGRL